MFNKKLVWIVAVSVLFSGCVESTKSVTKESFEAQKRDFFIESQKPIPPKMKALGKEFSSLLYNEKWKEAEALIAHEDDLSSWSRVYGASRIILNLIANEKVDILEQLVNKKLSIPMVEWKSNYKFLEKAYRQEKWESLKFLVTKGGYPFDKKFWMKPDGYRDYRPMQKIVKDKNIELLKLLVEHKIPVKAKHYKHDSPLIMAVKVENLEMIKLLVDAGANPNYNSLEGESAVALAQKSKDSSIRNYFQGDISSKSFSLDFLNKAIEKKDFALVKKIVDTKLNLNRKAKDYYERTPLEVAIDRGTTEIVNYLLDHGADINHHFGSYNKYNALYEMVSEDNGVELVKSALKHGVDVNVKVNKKSSALGRAFHSGKVGLACAKLLVENGAILNEVTNYDDQLPIHTALDKQDDALSNLIIDRMVKEGDKNLLSQKDEYGNTPLHYAVWGGSEEIINRLIKLGVDTKVKNNEGLQAISFSHNRKVLAQMEPYSTDKASIGEAYCKAYVRNRGDKSKRNHCNVIAKHYADIGKHADAINYYFLGNSMDMVKQYASDDSWMRKCNCKGYYAYFDIASAYLLSGDKERAKVFYNKLLKPYSSSDEQWLKLKFMILNMQHRGDDKKAKEVWREVWKEAYGGDFFKDSKIKF